MKIRHKLLKRIMSRMCRSQPRGRRKGNTDVLDRSKDLEARDRTWFQLRNKSGAM